MAAGTAPASRPPTAQVGDEPSTRRWYQREVVAFAFVALASLVIAVVTYRLWQLGSLSIPLSSSGDNPTALASIKTIGETGWYQKNPVLGWPAGQELYDFSSNPADNLHWLVLWVFGLFSSSPALVENLFILLSFPLAAVSGSGALRWLGISKTAAIVPAILFAVVPYHFVRAPYGHLFLAEYA